MKSGQLQLLSQLLANINPNKDTQRHDLRRSAVALLLDSNEFDRASLLMIQRAVHANDPWSGQMAFPGGRQEAEDKNAIATAKREMLEEVGFDFDHYNKTNGLGKYIGRLSDINTSQRALPMEMVVSPYVFLVEERPRLSPNYEVADTVWIPLRFFADISNRLPRKFVRGNEERELPCYAYSEDQIVWGMSLAMIDEILRASGMDLPDWYN